MLNGRDGTAGNGKLEGLSVWTVVYNFDISSSQQGHAKYALADSDYCGY